MFPCNIRRAFQLAVGLLLSTGLSANQSLLAADSTPAPRGKMLLIVAPRSFQDELQPYVQFKQQYLPTEFVALENVLKPADGADDKGAADGKVSRTSFKTAMRRGQSPAVLKLVLAVLRIAARSTTIEWCPVLKA